MRRSKPEGEGYLKVLGKLEALIMEALWQLESATGQEVCRSLGPNHNYKTVLTVMNRLVGKGLLSREASGRAYVYRPTQSREAFLRYVSRELLDGLLKDFGEVALVQFVDVLQEVSPRHLAALKRLAQDHRKGIRDSNVQTG